MVGMSRRSVDECDPEVENCREVDDSKGTNDILYCQNHNSTKPNNQQINESWVLHENDFAHHPTHPPETLLSALEQYRPTLG